MTIYNNIPQSTLKSSTDSTVEFFNNFYQTPVNLDGTDIVAVAGFFETAGFSKETADSVAMVILSQAKQNNQNPFQLLDTLKTLDGIQLSGIVGEILNYNRFKTSSLGISSPITPADEIQRNILA
jgi:hypothetical protein